MQQLVFQTIKVIVFSILVLATTACAMTPIPRMTRMKISQSSDLTVCQCYNSDQYWQMAQDEMKIRKLTRENCINLIKATKTSNRQPYFYREPNIMIFDPYFDPWTSNFHGEHDIMIVDPYFDPFWPGPNVIIID